MNTKRIALLIPNTDSSLETDLQLSLPEGWVVHTARMQLDEVGEQAERRMVDEALPEAIASLRGIARFDYAVFGCTSASAVYGPQGMQRIERMVSEAFDCPAISALGAVLRRIEQFGNPTLGVLTPYTDEVTAFFVRTLREFGVEVSHFAGLGLSDDPQIAAVPTERILSFAREQRQLIAPHSGLALFSCTNLRAFEVRKQLAAELGIAVITSNSSIIDWLIPDDD